MKKYLLKIIGTIFMITSFYQNIAYADTISPGEIELVSFEFFLSKIAIGVILVSIISIIVLNYIAKEDETKKREIKSKQNKIVKWMIVLLIICVVLFGLIDAYFWIGNSSGEPGPVDMTEAEILAFNAKFTRYEGRIRGSQVNALAQVVISNNNNQKEYGDTNFVEMKGEINIKKDSTSFEKLDISKYYTVTLSYQNSRVNEITVTENKESINN